MALDNWNWFVHLDGPEMDISASRHTLQLAYSIASPTKQWNWISRICNKYS
jgi:hypothetical protein